MPYRAPAISIIDYASICKHRHILIGDSREKGVLKYAPERTWGSINYLQHRRSPTEHTRIPPAVSDRSMYSPLYPRFSCDTWPQPAIPFVPLETSRDCLATWFELPGEWRCTCSVSFDPVLFALFIRDLHSSSQLARGHTGIIHWTSCIYHCYPWYQPNRWECGVSLPLRSKGIIFWI